MAKKYKGFKGSGMSSKPRAAVKRYIANDIANLLLHYMSAGLERSIDVAEGGEDHENDSIRSGSEASSNVEMDRRAVSGTES